MDVSAIAVSFPDPKRTEGWYFLQFPELQCGVRRVPLKLAREIRGSARSWMSAQLAPGPEMAALDAMLRTIDPDQQWACPQRAKEEQAIAAGRGPRPGMVGVRSLGRGELRSALCRARGGLALVRRCGRWASDAFRVYL